MTSRHSVLNREIVEKTLKGYRAVNEIVHEERRNYLKGLTRDEARHVFDQLHQSLDIWLIHQNTEYSKRSIEHHLFVREAMARLAKKLGYEPSI